MIELEEPIKAESFLKLVATIDPEGFWVDWEPDSTPLDEPAQKRQAAMYASFLANPNRGLWELGFSQPDPNWSTSLRFLHSVASRFIYALIRTPDLEQTRTETEVVLDPEDVEQWISNAPYLNGREHLNYAWFQELWHDLTLQFSSELAQYTGSVSAFLNLWSTELSLVGRVFFHLVENKNGAYPFAFLATYSSETRFEQTRHLPLKNALVEYQENQEKLLDLLSTVNQAAQKSRLIADFVDSGEIFHPIGLSAREAYTFLSEVPVYEGAGILCRIPKWWKSRAHSLKLQVKVGEKPPGHLSGRALIDFQSGLAIGDEPLSEEEITQLLNETEGLSLIKGKWVEVNHDQLEALLAAYKTAQAMAQRSDMTLIDALRFQMEAETQLRLQDGSEAVEITNGRWIQSVFSKLTHPETLEPVLGGPDFHADLRPYQSRGVAWLHYMKTLALGACLADDMGLGKTVQVIALLNHLRDKESAKALLVIPASLIGNWLDEIDKFAPSLRPRVLHPSVKPREGDRVVGPDLVSEYDLFITTYSMVAKNPWLEEVSWDLLILDEAQAIKNPQAKQTKTVKRIKAQYRIALTGTPIENRLGDLWSLFDFLNQGLLGTAKEFTKFSKQLSSHPEGYGRLRSVVSPFILRRLKTDPAVISDLPEKIEMKTFSLLSKRQAALYQRAVEDLVETLSTSKATGIQRQGLILSSLLKFKQICNHPDQYLGQKVYDPEESGKFQRLGELAETIFKKRERVLVFTQFREITAALASYLETIFHHPGLVLTGQTAVKDRKALVAKFQGHDYVPFLVLSLKAGGVGLNLTAANHVIHFDRWWNPAVENQATDRAFRIGQKKNVLVHKLISQGTIEEKIDALIEEKMRLSQEIVPTMQESWITEMDNERLLDLFRLSV